MNGDALSSEDKFGVYSAGRNNAKTSNEFGKGSFHQKPKAKKKKKKSQKQHSMNQKAMLEENNFFEATGIKNAEMGELREADL